MQTDSALEERVGSKEVFDDRNVTVCAQQQMRRNACDTRCLVLNVGIVVVFQIRENAKAIYSTRGPLVLLHHF